MDFKGSEASSAAQDVNRSATLWANITSVPLFARFFLGDTFQFGFTYRVFGYEVWLGEALLSISAYPPEYASWLDYIRDMGNLQGIKAEAVKGV